MNSIHPVALYCIASLALLVFALGAVVSAARGKSNIMIDQSADHDHMLNRLVRAHGNTSEYAVAFGILFLIHGMQQPSNLVIGLMIAATVARFVFVVGMLTATTLSRPSVLRGLGAFVTYVTGIWLSILIIIGV